MGFACDDVCSPPVAGRIDHNDRSYSGNVRQELHTLYNGNKDPNGTIVIWEGGTEDWTSWQHSARFCLAPYGFGWGIRLSQMMVAGCVPVIIQVRRARLSQGRCVCWRCAGGAAASR